MDIIQYLDIETSQNSLFRTSFHSILILIHLENKKDLEKKKILEQDELMQLKKMSKDCNQSSKNWP